MTTTAPSEPNQPGASGGSSYQIRPPYEEKFKKNEVKDIIHAVLIEELGGKCYDAKETQAWCGKICDEIESRVTQLPYKRYKYVTQVTIGEQRGSGVKFSTRCLWDVDTDNYSSDVFLNDTIFCVAVVYGIYLY